MSKDMKDFIESLSSIVQAEFVHSPSPSLTEQYDYANEHGIKWLVMITEADLAHGNSVKVFYWYTNFDFASSECSFNRHM